MCPPHVHWRQTDDYTDVWVCSRSLCNQPMAFLRKGRDSAVMDWPRRLQRMRMRGRLCQREFFEKCSFLTRKITREYRAWCGFISLVDKTRKNAQVRTLTHCSFKPAGGILIVLTFSFLKMAANWIVVVLTSRKLEFIWSKVGSKDSISFTFSNLESNFQYFNYLSNTMNVRYWDRDPSLKQQPVPVVINVSSHTFIGWFLCHSCYRRICLFKKLINHFPSLYFKKS